MLYSTRRSPYLCSPPGQTHLLLFNSERPSPAFVLLEQRQVDRVAQRLVAEVVRMQMVPAVVLWQHARGVTRVTQGLFKVDHGIKGAAAADPRVDGLALGLALGCI